VYEDGSNDYIYLQDVRREPNQARCSEKMKTVRKYTLMQHVDIVGMLAEVKQTATVRKRVGAIGVREVVIQGLLDAWNQLLKGLPVVTIEKQDGLFKESRVTEE
jgi:hypothetical protein